MNLSMESVFPVSPERLWHLLHDPATLARCIPGCERLDESGPDSYDAVLKIGIAAIKGTYTGKVRISAKQPFANYKLAIEGKASAGFVRGLANLELAEQAGGSTRLAIHADAQVGGLIASIGQRFLSGIARQLTEQFFKNLEKEAAAQANARAL